MKKILLVALLGLSLSGCATVSSMYNQAKDYVYPPAKPPVTEAPAVVTPPAPPVPETTIKLPEAKEDLVKPKSMVEAVAPKKKPKKKVDKLPFYTKERKKIEDDLQKEKAPAPPGAK